MRHHLISTYILIIVSLNALAQGRPLILSKTYDAFTTDIQENLYCWKNDGIDMYDASGKLRFHFNDPTLGNIERVDASMPTKIVVFYKEDNSIVLLNNKLSPIGSINLYDESIQTPSLVTVFGANRIACYDETSQQIHLIDLDLKQKSTTNCNFSNAIQPQLMVADPSFEYLYLCDSLSGIYVFDRFASFVKVIPVMGIEDMLLQNNTLYFLKQRQIFANNMTAMWSPQPVFGVDHIQSFSKVLSNWYIMRFDGSITKLSIRR